MTLLLASPPVEAPIAPPPDWSGLRMAWYGWDGSKWDLLSPTSGVRLTNGGIRGLAMPPVQRYTSGPAGTPGTRFRASRTAEREVFWPLLVFNDRESQAWLDHDAAFWRTMHPERPGSWLVTQPGGTSRTLTCRYVDDGDPSFTVLPAFDGWAVYGVRLVAEEPYWRGAAIVRSWGPTQPVNYYGGGDGTLGPPYHIASGSTLANARMDNPGDVEAWPVWTITGPTTSVTVGVGGRLLTFPTALGEGEQVVIDSRPGPRGKSVYDQDGNRRTPELTSRAWAAIPPGQSVELSLNMVGTGEVQAMIEPLYFRAW